MILKICLYDFYFFYFFNVWNELVFCGKYIDIFMSKNMLVYLFIYIDV
jgi:hypothetical protein